MKFVALGAMALAILASCNMGDNKNNPVDSSMIITKARDTMPDAPAAPALVDSAAAGNAWLNFATPGSMHQMLARDNGFWKGAITMWMAPGALPQKMIGLAANTMILGGRYQQSVHKGMMNGKSFEGISLVGYDNAKKKFITSWMDNMGTGIMRLEGDYDSTNKVIRLAGFQTDPVTGKDAAVRENLTYNPDGSQLMEMFGSQMAGGPEFKMMEIKFTRK